VIEAHFSASSGVEAAHTVVDCLAVGQAVDGGMDERVILFVKLPDGEKLSARLIQRIKEEVRKRRSPRHVPGMVSHGQHCLVTPSYVSPAQVIQVEDIPYTLNGKRVEVPIKKVRHSFHACRTPIHEIRKIINGSPLSEVNPSTLRNPGCLTAYAEIGKALRA
jgi:acetoacetyl-CoA synthetase